MPEFSVPKLTTLSSIPKSTGRRRVLFVTMPDGDPFDLIGPMTVLNDANWHLDNSGRPDLGYDIEVVTNKPGTVYQANGFQIYDGRGAKFNAVPFEGALETLEYFHRSSTRTALITNGASKVQRMKIDKYQLDQYFDVVLIEGEFGKGKPDPAVYTHLVTELDVSAQESWIVGDNLEWEVRAPQQLGFHAIWNDFLDRGLPPGHDVVPDRIINSIRELMEPDAPSG